MPTHIEPHETGMIDTGDGHQVYWEWSGNPDGAPAVYLHGGPGSGASPGSRNLFDSATHRIVILDQRGCGRSRPLAEHEPNLDTNTTAHLIRDIEAVRERLAIDRWFVLGISWGSTLAQAYAHAHPDRVRGLVLALVTTTSRREVDWITFDCGRIFPEEHARFLGTIPENLRDLRPVDAYAAMLADPDPAVRHRAARAWCDWEDTHVSLAPDHQPSPRYDDPDFRLRFATLVTHYWRHDAFLAPDQLLRDAHLLTGIPGVLIHGRYDVSGPLVTAWTLAQRWPTARLEVLGRVGHGFGDGFMPTMRAALADIAGGRG